VILVEKSSQRLFIYKFDGDYELVATYNCATGENLGDKRVSGDRKTPEGIYFFTKAVGEQYLTSTYGVRAFPMNYPNLMDIRRGKGGNNIWVHGTNEVLEERSTNGCIVLGNGDVAQLDSYIKLWNTPIIVEEQLKYEDRSTLLHQGQLLLETINGWSQAWSRKDLERYLSYYTSLPLRKSIAPTGSHPMASNICTWFRILWTGVSWLRSGTVQSVQRPLFCNWPPSTLQIEKLHRSPCDVLLKNGDVLGNKEIFPHIWPTITLNSERATWG
jgi:hypothetical protein